MTSATDSVLLFVAAAVFVVVTIAGGVLLAVRSGESWGIGDASDPGAPGDLGGLGRPEHDVIADSSVSSAADG